MWFVLSLMDSTNDDAAAYNNFAQLESLLRVKQCNFQCGIVGITESLDKEA